MSVDANTWWFWLAYKLPRPLIYYALVRARADASARTLSLVTDINEILRIWGKP